MAELLSWNHCLRSKTISKGSSGSKVHEDWTIEQWNKVVWIDKSKFEIFGSNRRVYVQWQVDEGTGTPCITPIVKHGGGSVIVWGAFANSKVGDLHQAKGKLNQTGYLSIPWHHAILFGTWLVGQGFVFMQDNDPKHTSKFGRSKLKAERNSMSVNWCLGRRNQWT